VEKQIRERLDDVTLQEMIREHGRDLDHRGEAERMIDGSNGK
jgi:hypothetical protein